MWWTLQIWNVWMGLEVKLTSVQYIILSHSWVLPKHVTLFSTIMQLPWSATAYLDILTTVDSPWYPHGPAHSLPTWSSIGIPVAFRTSSQTGCECQSLLFFLPLALLHLLSFVFRTSRCWGNHFRQPNQNHLHIAFPRKALPLHSSFRFMRTRPDGCPHWPCQGSKHASVIRANSYWMALH